MIDAPSTLRCATPLLAVAEEVAAGPQLPPTTRAAVLITLVVIILVGVLLIAATLLGGHWVRRQGVVRRGPVVPPDRPPLPRLSAAAGNDAAQSEDSPATAKGLRDTQHDVGETHPA